MSTTKESFKKSITEVNFTHSSYVFHESIDIHEKELLKIARKHNLSEKGEKTVMVAMKIPMLIEWKRATHSDDTHIIRFVDDTNVLKDLYHSEMGKDKLVESKGYVEELKKKHSFK